MHIDSYISLFESLGIAFFEACLYQATIIGVVGYFENTYVLLHLKDFSINLSIFFKF